MCSVRAYVRHAHLQVDVAALAAAGNIDDLRSALDSGGRLCNIADALALSIAFAQDEITDLLLERGAPLHASNSIFYGSALHVACEHGQLEAAEKLLAYGADLEDTRDYTGVTPLWYALLNRQMAVALFLIEAGAAVNARLSSAFLDQLPMVAR
jgi:ankyrin repeat protein